MILIGLLYQYDSEQGTGALMVGDGEKREFHIEEWVDSTHQPSVGQKISYEHNGYRAQIRVATQEDIERAESENSTVTAQKETAPKNSREFENADACITYFTEKGFKKVKDFDDNGVRNVVLRSLINGDPYEVTALESETLLEVKLAVNGKIEPIT